MSKRKDSNNGSIKPLHILNLYLSGCILCTGQEFIKEKTNEIPTGCFIKKCRNIFKKKNWMGWKKCQDIIKKLKKDTAVCEKELENILLALSADAIKAALYNVLN